MSIIRSVRFILRGGKPRDAAAGSAFSRTPPRQQISFYAIFGRVFPFFFKSERWTGPAFKFNTRIVERTERALYNSVQTNMRGEFE